MPIHKLTRPRADALRAMYQSGATVAACARAFGVSHTQATRIIRGRHWTDKPARVAWNATPRDDVAEMRELIAAGKRNQWIAEWLGVSPSLVSLVRHRRRWAA